MPGGSEEPNCDGNQARDQSADGDIEPEQEIMKTVEVVLGLGERMLEVELPLDGNADDVWSSRVERGLDRVVEGEHGESRAERHNPEHQSRDDDFVGPAHALPRRPLYGRASICLGVGLRPRVGDFPGAAFTTLPLAGGLAHRRTRAAIQFFFLSYSCLALRSGLSPRLGSATAVAWHQG